MRKIVSILIIIAILHTALASANCPETPDQALIISNTRDPLNNNFRRILENNNYQTSMITTQEELTQVIDTLAKTSNCNTNIIIKIANSCLANTCPTTTELITFINTIQSCNKKIITSNNLNIPNAELYTLPASQLHNYFITQLTTKFDFHEAFAQTKAYDNQKNNPTLMFPTTPCTCTCPEKKETKQEPQKIIPTAQKIQTPILPPPQPPTPTPAPEPQQTKLLPKISILITPVQHDTQQLITTETNCAQECMHINTPKGMKQNPLEVVMAATQQECEQRTSFATITPKQPCTDYFVASRTVFTKINKETSFRCCCRKIATSPTRRCRPENFLGWTKQGTGIIKGQNHEIAYTP